MRLFIGIMVDETTGQKLNSLTREIAEGFRKWRPTDPSNYHITIKFIGETDMDTLEVIKGCVKTAARGIEKFNTRTIGAGSFARNNGQTVFYKVKKEDRLEKLYKMVCCELRRSGISSSEQKFFPHITVAREVALKDGFSFPVQKDIILDVDSISVMESTRLNGKLIYIPEFTVRLEDAENDK
ncbi:MAG: RNA 2',3'-cyclic phosphodiesterase [Clostridia bacterium]|nr:RNA 2',3'-cyclic phosphodiesterase [Clostridia bacterium]